MRPTLKVATYLSVILFLCILYAEGAIADDESDREATWIELLAGGDALKANQAAGFLGRVGSVRGLEKILVARNSTFLEYYNSSYRAEGADWEGPVQDLFVKYFNVPELRDTIILLLYQRRITNIKLFDLVYEVARSGEKVRNRDRWLRTLYQSKIKEREDYLLKLYPLLNQTEKLPFLAVMMERKQATGLPYFKNYLQEEPVGEHHRYVHEYLNRFESKEAADILVSLLPQYRVPNPTAEYFLAVASVVHKLDYFNKNAEVDYDAVVEKISYKENDNVAEAYINLVYHHRPHGAENDMIRYLNNKQLHNDALNAVMSYTDLKVWNKALAELERAYQKHNIDGDFYKYAISNIHDRSKHYDQEVAERKKEDRHNELNKDISAAKKRYFSDQESLVIDDVTATEGFLRMLVALYGDHKGEYYALELANQIANGYIFLGNHYRFIRKDVGSAIAAYQNAYQFDIDSGLHNEMFPSIALAELHQFDREDKDIAIQWYENALAALSGSELEKEMYAVANLCKLWLKNEIGFLRTGHRFSGTLTKSDLKAFAGIIPFADAMNWSYSLSNTEKDKKRVTGSFSDIKSHFNFLNVIGSAANAEAADILGALDKVDPSGFWQANYFGLYRLKESKGSEKFRLLNMALLDAGNIQIARKVYDKRLMINYQLNPRKQFSSPEKTFQALKDALKEHDIKKALECFASNLAGKYSKMFAMMDKDKMLAMGKELELGGMTSDLGKFREYVIYNKESKRGGSIQFGIAEEEWLIVGM